MSKKPSSKNKKTVLRSLKAPATYANRFENKETNNAYRTTFMRDRDRVLYSAPFRLLAGKTQVYITGIDDNMRTRLTHTLEVAQIAKTIAAALRLDVDLVETIALGHDIGHTPYGHAGERALHEIMNPSYNHPIKGCPCDLADAKDAEEFIKLHTSELGFKHNLHSVGVAVTEASKTMKQSLSLTNFSLYGMCAHSSLSYGDNDKLKVGYYERFQKYYELNGHDAWSFEAFVVEEADEIAQRHHDLEDAIRGDLLSTREVNKQINIYFKYFFTYRDRQTLRSMKQYINQNKTLFFAKLSQLVVNMLVTRLIKYSMQNLNQFIEENDLTERKFKEYILDHDGKNERCLIGYDLVSDTNGSFHKQLSAFKTVISTQVLDAYDIQRADAKGKYIIRKLTQALYSGPQQLPDECLFEYYMAVNNIPYDKANKRVSDEGVGKLRKECINDIQKAQEHLALKTADELVNSQWKLIILMRTICNYIAGMTDHALQVQYHDLYG